MEPCQGPSLTGGPQPVCGCVSAASPAAASAWDLVPVAFPLLFFALLFFVLVRRARALAEVDGLEPAREFVPRLVLSEGERRFFRAIGRAFRRPRASEFRYSQPRFRNQTSMPPPMAMQTPQKIG